MRLKPQVKCMSVYSFKTRVKTKIGEIGAMHAPKFEALQNCLLSFYNSIKLVHIGNLTTINVV
jgi:hypothetical protein